MKILKQVLITTLTTVIMSVGVFANDIKDVNLNLTYDGKTIQYNAKEVKVVVDGDELSNLDMPAVIIDGRTLVPLRAIFEKMGGDVSWEPASRQITAVMDNETIVMHVDSRQGTVNGKTFDMDVAPKIINDRTMVPVRAVAEAVGAGVKWDDTSRTVEITKNYIIGEGSNDHAVIIGGDKQPDKNDEVKPEEKPEVKPEEKPEEKPEVKPDTDLNTNIGKPDSSKVTSLSHIDPSEIDTEAVQNAANEVKVVSVVPNGNDMYTINTTGRISQYKYATVLGKRVAIDIYNSSLAVANKNIPINDAPVQGIRMAQNAINPYKIVRVVFDLTNVAGDYTVTPSADGKSLIVNFGDKKNVTPPPVKPDNNGTIQKPVNKISNIEYRTSANNDMFIVYTDEKPEYDVYALQSPYRIVVDVYNSEREFFGVPDFSTSKLIDSVNFSTLGENKTRFVLSVKEGTEFNSISGNDFIRVTISKPAPAAKITAGIINDGKTFRFTKTNGIKASAITKSYDPYSGNNIIYLNGDYSSAYPNKIYNYAKDDPMAAYIKTAKINTANGKTTITLTPSLIAEYKIYEQGDYIYLDMVPPKSVYDAVVVIDAGHGGMKPGAIVGGVNEKDITLDIAKRVYNLFQGSNIKIYVTRLTDSHVDNYKRAYMANYGADMFISIHCNSISGNVKISGTETLYAPHSGEGGGKLSSWQLADALQRNVTQKAGTSNRGLKQRPDLIVLNRTTVPAALVETGFMTDSKDMGLLTSPQGRQKFAEGIYQAINEIVRNTKLR